MTEKSKLIEKIHDYLELSEENWTKIPNSKAFKLRAVNSMRNLWENYSVDDIIVFFWGGGSLGPFLEWHRNEI